MERITRLLLEADHLEWQTRTEKILLLASLSSADNSGDSVESPGVMRLDVLTSIKTEKLIGYPIFIYFEKSWQLVVGLEKIQ